MVCKRVEVVCSHIAPESVASTEDVPRFNDGQLQGAWGPSASDARPVGEFGSLEWCHHCGHLGARLLEEAVQRGELVVAEHAWGFSELYINLPERLVAGRAPDQTGFFFGVVNGRIVGGAGVPADVLKLDGFHIIAPWAAIVSQSSLLYDHRGNELRMRDETAMWQALRDFAASKDVSLQRAFARKPMKWPKVIGTAVSKGSSLGGGLHNLTAKALKGSAEIESFPKTAWAVPNVKAMTDSQREAFLEMIGHSGQCRVILKADANSQELTL